MKFAKIALLLFLSLFVLIFVTACRCEPSTEDWYFFSYKKDMAFINGVTLTLGFSDASEVYPFAGAANQNIGISFSNDGKVQFTDIDGETHLGYYTYEHFKNRYTDFVITLENGDIIEGSSIKSGKNAKLSLTYKNIIYNFSTSDQRNGVTLDDVVKNIAGGNYDTLNEATVVKREDGYSVFFSDILSYPIKEDTAVYAMRIYPDGTYEVLDEIYEGEVLSTYNNDADYVILYYIEK